MEKFYSKTRRYSSYLSALALVAFSLMGVYSANAQLNGNYTINKNGSASTTNFQSFTSAVQALRGVARSDGGPSLGTGVNGAVTFTVTVGSGPYNEQIVIPAITGASSVNRITFEGNQQTVEFNTSSTTNTAVFSLDGADYITLNNIYIKPTNSTYGRGVWLYNRADYNIISNCKMDITSSTSTSNGAAAGIVMAGSATSATSYTTGGIKGIGNLFKNNEIFGSSTNNGMYSGIILNGGSSVSTDGNVVEGNIIRNFYLYGIYCYYNLADIVFRGNTITRGTKPTITTFYGIYSYYCPGSKFYDNFIADGAPTTSTYTFTGYGIYSYYGTTASVGMYEYINNTVKFTNGYYLFGFYALEYYTSGKKFLHNTVYMNVPNMYYGYGIYTNEYNYGAIDIKNNIVDIRANNLLSTTYNIYNYSYSTPTINGNVLPRTTSSYHYTGYVYSINLGGGQAQDWAAWRANPNNPDPNGSDVRPQYVDPATNNFTPMTIDLDGAGVQSNVPKDQKGNTRSVTTPDPGAIEFDLPINVSSLNYPSAICQGEIVNVEVGITNNAAFALGSFKVEYYINGTLSSVADYTGSIASGATATFIFPVPISNTQTGNFTLTANVKGKPTGATKAYSVNPSPVGSLFTKGSPFNGSFNSGDGQDPDIVAYGDNIRYAITPPTGYLNSGFGSTWTFDFWEMKTVNGTDAGASHTKTNPGSSSNAVSSFTPLLGQSDSLYRIRYAIRSLSNGCVAPVVTREIFVAPRPVTAFVASSVCEGDKVQFSNNSSISSGSVSYIWRFGDGDSTWLINPEHTYPSYGTYNVTLVAVSNYGYTSVSTGTAVVKQNPVAEFSSGNRCEGVAIPFSDGSIIPSGTPTYSWDFGDGTFGTGNTPSHLYSTAGVYEVKLRVTADGCSDESVRFVTQAPLPVAGFSASNTGCNSNLVTFTNNSTIASGTVGYEWSFGDNTTSSVVSPSHRYNIFGNVTVNLTVKSNFGCIATTSQQINLIEAPAADFTFGANCSKEDIQFTNTTVEPAGSNTSYSWEFSDGTNASTKDVTKSFSAIGSYTVKVTAIASNGCQDVKERVISVDEMPTAAFIAEDVCEGSDVTFLNASVGNMGNLTYTWDFGGGLSSTAVNPVQALPVGTHQVTLTVLTPSGCTDQVVETVTVNETPDFTMNVVSGTMGNGTMSFTATGVPANATYVWFFGDGGRESGSTGAGGNLATTYTYVHDGLYDASLRISQNGCSSTESAKAGVYRTSVADLTENGMNIYPNPGSGKFVVELTNVKEVNAILVYNANGQLVASLNSTDVLNGTAQLNLTQQSSGVYLVKVLSSEGVFQSRITLNK